MDACRTGERQPQSRLRLGVARGEITPPVGIYHRMWGAATHQRATGVHRPLTATALCLAPLAETGVSPTFLLAVDHCLLWGSEQQELLEQLSARTGVEPGRIVVCWSHTHAAGLLDRSRAAEPGGELIGPTLEALHATLADLMIKARETLEPACLVYGTADCRLATNRDYFEPGSGRPVCGYNPDGPADRTALVARAVSQAGKTLCTVVNYACHPTTLAWGNTLISPDYPGAMRELLEEAEGGAPCLFLQGASADLGPRHGFVASPEVADRNGRQLGYAALSALEALDPPGTTWTYGGAVVSGATLGEWSAQPVSESENAALAQFRFHGFEIPLAYRPDLPQRDEVLASRATWEARKREAEARGEATAARDAHAMIERMDRQLTRLRVLPPDPRFPLPVWTWRLGDALWIACEGELYQSFQQELRRRFPGLAVMVVTLANGSRVTYLPEAAAYGQGSYPESISLLARGALEELVEGITRELRGHQTQPA
ncbi:MAG: hypothetical protein ACKOGA_08440 [Planctomycetaceae bacterium]